MESKDGHPRSLVKDRKARPPSPDHVNFYPKQ